MDRALIEELYVRYAPMVLRRARMLLRSEAAAKDAVQEVFVRALRAGGAADGSAFRAEASPATWLYRIVTNYCLNLLRDEARRAELWREHGEPFEEGRDGGRHGFARVALAQIFAAISPELREVASYYLIDEMTHDEIAELLGVSRRTVGHRIEELRAAVRDLEPFLEAS